MDSNLNSTISKPTNFNVFFLALGESKFKTASVTANPGGTVADIRNQLFEIHALKVTPCKTWVCRHPAPTQNSADAAKLNWGVNDAIAARLPDDAPIEKYWKSATWVAFLVVQIENEVFPKGRIPLAPVQSPNDHALFLQVFVATFQGLQPSDLNWPSNEITPSFTFVNNRPQSFWDTSRINGVELVTLLKQPRVLKDRYILNADLNKLGGISTMYTASWKILFEKFGDKMKDIVSGDTTVENPEKAYVAEILSYAHLSAFCMERIKQVLLQSSFSKEDSFALVADPALYAARGKSDCHYDKGVGWNTRIIVRSSKDETATYGPKNDFNLVSEFGPLILVEVVSDKIKEEDRVRLLLQSTAACRLLDLSRKAGNYAPPPVLAIYVNKDLQSEWYFVYKENAQSNGVRIVLIRTFNLQDQFEACQHLAYLYNYVDLVLPRILSRLQASNTVKLLAKSENLKGNSLTSKGKKK